VYLSSDEKQDIVGTLKQAIPILQAVYVFGSRQDGTATTLSDIDIAYLSDETLGAVARWDIAQNLASVLSYDVDLVDLRQTDTIFRYQIISTGTRIYGEGYGVESFETLAYSFYLRFQEERRPIVEAIMKNRSVSGGMHA
jgi:predicted nucleotidyltransferase